MACTAAVLACMAWVDRPVADYVQAHFGGTLLLEWTTRALSVLPPALFVLLALRVYQASRATHPANSRKTKKMKI